jgi:hypothetical protein
MYRQWPQSLRSSEAVAGKVAASVLIDLGDRPLPKLYCSGWDVQSIADMWLATFFVTSRTTVQGLWFERFGRLGTSRDVLWRFRDVEYRIHRPVLWLNEEKTVGLGFSATPSVLRDHGGYIRV